MAEISGFADAQARLQALYEVPKHLPASLLDDYARIAVFLSNRKRFEQALTTVSERLWSSYCLLGRDTRNRFTTAIAQFATQYGFMLDPGKQCVTNTVVLVGAVSGAQYLEWVKSGIFFKDDMDLKHGEHTHTLQWLAISVARKEIGLAIAESPGFLYRSIYDIKAKANQGITVPGFKLKPKADNQAARSGVSLWSWLLDGFPLSMATGQAYPTGESLFTQSYRCPQVLMEYLVDGTPADHFIGTYLRFRYRRRRWLQNEKSGYAQISGGGTSKNYMQSKLEKDTRWTPVKEGHDTSAFVKKAPVHDTLPDLQHLSDGKPRNFVKIQLHCQWGELRDPNSQWV